MSVGKGDRDYSFIDEFVDIGVPYLFATTGSKVADAPGHRHHLRVESRTLGAEPVRALAKLLAQPQPVSRLPPPDDNLGCTENTCFPYSRA